MNGVVTTFQERIVVKMCDLAGAHEPRETSPPVGLEPTTFDLEAVMVTTLVRETSDSSVGYDILSAPTKMRFLPREWRWNNIPRADCCKW